jgi:hypothetical protein
MQLDDEHKRILDGGRGKILQAALTDLFKYGKAMGADLAQWKSLEGEDHAMKKPPQKCLDNGVPVR